MVQSGTGRAIGVVAPSGLSTNRQDRDTVWFYLPERKALHGVDPLTLDPDRDWAIFGTGVYVWILQTFLRLRMAGAPVQLVDRPPARGTVIAHASHLPRLIAHTESRDDLIVVAARSDKGPQPLADFGVVQNAADADHDNFFVPSWLQPGLVPRRPQRGSCLKRAVYYGSIKELDPQLTTSDWAEALLARGLEWDTRTITFGGDDQLYHEHRWNDYAETDVVVALRPCGSWHSRSKPAAKLQNAWAAGVPAILSPEVQYQHLRHSALDYIEARSGADVLVALDRLRTDPALYAAMIRNGLDRASEFAADRLVGRWVDVLWGDIPQRADRLAYRVAASARRCRALVRRLGRHLSNQRSIETR